MSFHLGRVGFRALVHALTLAALASRASAQIQDQVMVWVKDPVTFEQRIARFDRKLQWLSSTPMPQPGSSYVSDLFTISLDGLGRYWIPFDPTSYTTALVLTALGIPQMSPLLGHNPMQSGAGRSGDVFFTTRIPFSSKGPLYCLRADGTTKWASWDAVAPFSALPQSLAVATDGSAFVGGVAAGACGCLLNYGIVARVDSSTGGVLGTTTFPGWGPGSGMQTSVYNLAAAPDGTIWALVSTPQKFWLYQIQGSTVVNGFQAPGGWNGGTGMPRVDGAGNLYVVEYNEWPLTFGNAIRKVDPATGIVLAVYPLDHGGMGNVGPFALGPAGDELFSLTGTAPDVRYLNRTSLVTGVRSVLRLEPNFAAGILAGGDPTGFIYANIVDREGDADGDGVANGVETRVNTNPYDPTSVPWGPRVYLSWTNAGGLRLRYVDADGLLSPTGGLVALDLQVEGYGDLLPFFGAYVSHVSFDPGFTDLTIEFDGFPIPPNLKLRFEARAQDATGAVGSDWAVSPPGTL